MDRSGRDAGGIDDLGAGGGGFEQADYDVVIVGSGFGGSVSALRLTEKGYSVLVVEAGRRFADDDFPKTSWRLSKYLWAPKLRLFGIQRIHMLRNVLVLAGAGVGGGSLVYANTLYRPPEAFFADRQWAHITDWAAELEPHYDRASAMLGVTDNPADTPADEVIRSVAERMGRADTFRATPVAVHFGRPGQTVPDPYFGGVGPDRVGCTECGACMTGCRVGAKNTLVKNYLHLAERAGVEVMDTTTVNELRPSGDGRWRVSLERTGRWRRSKRNRSTILAGQVVLAAGTWGTQNLLHRMAAERVIDDLPPALGRLTRTNSEAIVGSGRLSIDPDRDFTRGVAITSSFHPDDNTHVEPVRYGRGSNVMGLFQTFATEGDTGVARWRQAVDTVRRDPGAMRMLNLRRWSERTMILLVMQTLDNSLTTSVRRGLGGRWKLTSEQGHGEPNPDFIRSGWEANRLVADEIGGIQGSTWNEMFGIPITAHFIGGCVIGDGPESGVIDPYHRVYGHPTLHVVDGSAVSANLGVNPALTITAQAERAMSLWPNKGDADPRPEQADGYLRIDPIAPTNPAVPAASPAALRT